MYRGQANHHPVMTQTATNKLTAYDKEMLSALYKVEDFFKSNDHQGLDAIQDAIKMIEANK